jgi:hypothetical protein
MTEIRKKVSEKYLGKSTLETINGGYPYSPSLALIMTGKPISSALAIPSSTLPTQPRLFHQTSFTHLKINERGLASLCLTNIMCLKELGLTMLEERRHHADMVQTYKIVTGKDMVISTWFTSVTESGRPTRSAANPLNLRPQASMPEIRRQFFSQRVVESWNKIPASLKQAKNVKCFKNGRRSLRDIMVENT